MVEKSDIFADDYWKEQWRAVVAREKTLDGEDVNLLTMAVQLARRWGPTFCPQCRPKAKKLIGLVDAAYKILSARREQMVADKKRSQALRKHNGESRMESSGDEFAQLRVLEVLQDIRDGLSNLHSNNGQH